MSAPMLLAICGAPGSGKTTVADFITSRWNAMTIDDGAPLRRACMEVYGLSWADVMTQEGKAKTIVTANGSSHQVRDLLGLMGNHLEALHGDGILAELALARLNREYPDTQFAVFPSCRKTQGHVYAAAGGKVLEIVRPGCVATRDFDRYDQSAVSCTLVNNGSIDDLKFGVVKALVQLFQTREDYAV